MLFRTTRNAPFKKVELKFAHTFSEAPVFCNRVPIAPWTNLNFHGFAWYRGMDDIKPCRIFTSVLGKYAKYANTYFQSFTTNDLDSLLLAHTHKIWGTQPILT